MRDLETIYRRALYVVKDGEVEFTIRLGRQNSDLQAFLAGRGAYSWAFLTAYNPNSEPDSVAANNSRQSKLVQLLEERSYTYCTGYGTGEDWDVEPSLFVIDISRESAIEIAQIFGQTAILWGENKAQPDLLWCKAD